MRAPTLAAASRRANQLDAVELTGWAGLAVVAAGLALAAAERPLFVLVGAAAGAIVVAALARTEIAILLVVATAPLESAFASGPGGISVTKLTGGLLLASFALTLVRTRRELVLERSQAVVLGILAIAMLSTLQAQEPSAAVTTTTRYASFALFFVIVTQFAHDRRLARRIVWVLSATTAISAGLGLYEYFTGGSPVATLRYSNADDFGFILATSLPLMFWLLGTRKALRPLVIGMIGLVFAALLLSLARGALVGLGVGVVFLLLTDKRRFQLTLVGGLLAAVAAVAVVHSNPARFQNALLLKSVVAQQNVATRYEVWGAAARLASEHPLLGVGPGNFQFFFFKLTERPVGTFALTVAHNAYLDIAAELGVIAMALFVIYLLMSFARLTDSVRRGYGEPGLAQALRISLVIASVISLTLSEQYYLPFWLLGGLATAIWIDGRQQDEVPEER